MQPVLKRESTVRSPGAEPSTSSRVTVLKVGGARLGSPVDLDDLARQVQDRIERDHRIVVVHGGGPEINDLHEKLDVPFVRVEGLRATSDEGMAITTMVLCGLVQTRIVERFTRHGMACLGVSGVDFGLLRAPMADPDLLGRVGGPPRVDRERLMQLLETADVLVVSPVSIGPDGAAVNVNADDAAHAIAQALRADSLDFVSDIPGVMTGDGRTARWLGPKTIERLIRDGVVHGGMVPKLKAAVAAVRAGVLRVRIGDLGTLGAGRATVISATGRPS